MSICKYNLNKKYTQAKSVIYDIKNNGFVAIYKLWLFKNYKKNWSCCGNVWFLPLKITVYIDKIYSTNPCS
jgi:hypothetical protein